MSTVVNDDNPYHDNDIGKGGNNTNDKIFLLSIQEASKHSYGFNSNYCIESETRYGSITKFAKDQGELSDSILSKTGNYEWILRTPGADSDDISFVDEWGAGKGANTGIEGCLVGASRFIRPALHLRLSSSLWMKGEKLKANLGVESETEYFGGNDNLMPSPIPGNEKGNGTGSSSENNKVNTGSTTGESTIARPAKVKGLKLKNQKRKASKISFSKVTGAAGYQIQYALNKKFTKNKKSKYIKKTSYTVKKLKKKKTYYFRIRAYKLNGKKKVYGKWSSVKKVKIKK